MQEGKLSDCCRHFRFKSFGAMGRTAKNVGSGPQKKPAVAEPASESDSSDGEGGSASSASEKDPVEAGGGNLKRAYSWDAAAARVATKKAKLAQACRDKLDGQPEADRVFSPTAVAVLAQVASADEMSKMNWTDVEDPCGIMLAECRKQRIWLDNYSRILRAGRGTPAKWLEMLRKQDVSRTLVHNLVRQIRATAPRPERRGSSSSGSAPANVRGSGGHASNALANVRGSSDQASDVPANVRGSGGKASQVRANVRGSGGQADADTAAGKERKLENVNVWLPAGKFMFGLVYFDSVRASGFQH